MTSIIFKASKGQRVALEHLYEAHKQKAFYIASSLLMDKTTAISAVVFAFRETWRNLKTADIKDEDRFDEYITAKIVDYCKNKVYKNNPKAFKASGNISVNLQNTQIKKPYDDETEYLLRNITLVQRYIFVLHTICGYSESKISRTLKLDTKTIKEYIDAQKSTFEKLQTLSSNICNSTYEDILKSFESNTRDIIVPGYLDFRIKEVIESVAVPYETRNLKLNKLIRIVCTVCLICILGCTAVLFFTGTIGDDDTSSTASIDTSLTYYADIDIQNYGTITIELDPNAAPETVTNFINLSNDGFYDGLTFHRIIEGFMMQGGDPNRDGTGGSGTNIIGEFSENGHDNNLSHTRGAVSMARADDYDSASSQFFIVQEDYTSLDGQYAVFGYVTDGMDIVDAICQDAEPLDANGAISAENQPVISYIAIRTISSEE